MGLALAACFDVSTASTVVAVCTPKLTFVSYTQPLLSACGLRKTRPAWYTQAGNGDGGGGGKLIVAEKDPDPSASASMGA